MKYRVAVGAIATILAATTTAAQATGDPALLSTYGKAVFAKLPTDWGLNPFYGFGQGKDIISYNNVLAGGGAWLWQTPPEAHFGHADVVAHHSDAFPTRIGTLITNANHFVDISTLGAGDPPSGLFEAQILHGLAQLEARAVAPPVQVRILLGEFGAPGDVTAPGATAFRTAVLNQVQAYTHVKVYVGFHNPNSVVWNHAKIMAVDGTHLVIGGHNLEDHYLVPSAPHSFPVHDVSMELTGDAAKHAHTFVNALWDDICEQDKEIGDAPPAARYKGKVGKVTQANFLRGSTNAMKNAHPACPPHVAPGVAAKPGSITAGQYGVIFMGRPSPSANEAAWSLFGYPAHQMDIQLRAMITEIPVNSGRQRGKIYISQQSLAPRADFGANNIVAQVKNVVANAMLGVNAHAITGPFAIAATSAANWITAHPGATADDYAAEVLTLIGDGTLEQKTIGVTKYWFIGGWPIVETLGAALTKGNEVYVTISEIPGDWGSAWSVTEEAQHITDEALKIVFKKAKVWDVRTRQPDGSYHPKGVDILVNEAVDAQLAKVTLSGDDNNKRKQVQAAAEAVLTSMKSTGGGLSGLPDKLVAAASTTTPTNAIAAYKVALSSHVKRWLCNVVHFGGMHTGESAPHTGRWAGVGGGAAAVSAYNGERQKNHAKMILVDAGDASGDKAFYIGSQNLYYSPLAEAGVFIDSSAMANDLKTRYFDHVWQYANPTAVIGRFGVRGAYAPPAGYCTILDSTGPAAFPGAPATSD